MNSPFPPLVPGGEGLDRLPAEPEALRWRMAEVYGVREDQVLPIRGPSHGLELIYRYYVRAGAKQVAWNSAPVFAEPLAALYGFEVVEDPLLGADFMVEASPGDSIGGVADEAFVEAYLGYGSLDLLVVDETGIEFTDARSLAGLAVEREDLVVLRSLSLAYGLAGAPCGALIASPALIERFSNWMEPDALSTPVVRLAEAALSPSRALATLARVDRVKNERARLVEALADAPLLRSVNPGEGPYVFVVCEDLRAAGTALIGLQVDHDWCEALGADGLRISVSASPEINDRTLVALGVAVQSRPRRVAEVSRDTKETKIAVSVDLDTPGRVKAVTGVGYFDHMLEQIAFHGGFSLELSCEGDLHIDTHHTIEDCALAFGTALKQALGDRRGIARFGFLLPMDETEAKVSIDLGGRPFSVFKGEFKSALLGEYPTEMTAHVFRSLAETLGAAIHVEVTGENDHHKTEACFKAFGRALRQAIRIEGSEVPSTKGVI